MAENNNLLKKEIRVLNAMRSTLIEVVKDTMTKPGMRHPLEEKTRMMITDCLNLISARQAEIEKDIGKFSNMKPKFKDDSVEQSFSLDKLKATLKKE